MNSLRFRGSTTVETCSADTTVPWMTSTSSPASTAASQCSRTRCGVSDAAARTPPALISRIRRATSSGLIGSR